MRGDEKIVCYKHEEETKGLRSCKDCGTIFCGFCLTYNTDGAIVEVIPHCPECVSRDIVDVR